jgi:hypothetical protein
MKRILRAAMLTALASAMLAADVSYQETITITVHMYGKTAKQVLEGCVYLKGNQMASELCAPFLPNTQSTLPHSSVIYDLDAGTVTSINRDKQTYAVQTFDDVTQELKLKQLRLGRVTDLQFDAKDTTTGRTKQIDGETATESVITLKANGTATGQMVVTVHAWLVPMSPSRQPVRDFQKRLGEKVPSLMSSVVVSSSVSSLNLDAAIFKEMFRTGGGYPILTESWLGPDNPMAGLNGGTNANPNAPPIIEEVAVHNFVQGVVDKSKFTVPAGYALVKFALLYSK